MHSIERYGIVALLFLVVTVVAVLMWDGGQEVTEADRVLAAGGAASAAKAPRADSPRRLAAAERNERRLSLLAESQPGPLLRPIPANDQPLSGGEAQPQELVTPPEAGWIDPTAESEKEPLPALTNPVQPAPDRVIAQGAPAATGSYVVRSGDTLSEIAQRELGSSRRWQEIVAANPGLDPKKLLVGKTLRIPGGTTTSAAAVEAQAPKAKAKGGTWTVGKGENLWRIAEKTLGDGKRWREIADANPGMNADRLLLGQVLSLPAGAKIASGTTSTKPGPLVVSTDSNAARRGGVR